MRLLAAVMCGCAMWVWIRPTPVMRLAGLHRPQQATSSRRTARKSPPPSSAFQAPLVADLLGAAVESGLPVSSATHLVKRALDGVIGSEIGLVVRAYDMGASAEEAWRRLPVDSALLPIAQAVVRSSNSGAALGPVLRSCADDLRRDYRTRAEVAARTAGVRAIGPLAACFLPAFLILGVVPVVASMAEQVFTG